MIEFHQVTRRFRTGPRPGRAARTIDAVHEITLQVPAGSVWAVVGPNGAGKTTLFALLLGFLHPSSGVVRIEGDEPRRYLRRHGAGYLPERFELPRDWTVRSALRALARLEGLAAAAARRRADELLARLELETHAGQRVHALSRGLLQRLGLAQALLGEHALLVLDEPTEGLDPLWRIRFRVLVEELRAQGRTLLLASHDLAEVERLADRAVLLEQGRIREVLEVRVPAGTRPERYRIELAEPSTAVTEAFPAAVGDGRVFDVTVSGAAELSGRLAALLAAGALLRSVQPAAEPLEARVTRVLRPEDGA